MKTILIFTQCLALVSGFLQYTLPNAKSQSSILHRLPKELNAKGPSLRSDEWARQRGYEPGFGGVWKGDPNAPKFNVTIVSKQTHETFSSMVPNDRYIYSYFEEKEIDVPFINRVKMCRQGCCTVCAVRVVEGKVEMEGGLGLLKELKEKGFTLSCCSLPRSDVLCELQEEDFVYSKQFGEPFASGGVKWGGVLPEED
jgi:ferredoxin